MHADAHDRFRTLFDRHYPQLTAYARRRLPAAEAADLVADVMLVAWRRLDDVPAGDDAALWLYGVARRTLANQRRSGRRREQLTVALRRERPATAVEAAAGDRQAIADVLRRLPPGDKEILLLSAWEGLAPPELSVVLGCSVNAAAVRLHRARKRLVALLEQAERSGDSRTWDRVKGGTA